jgi:hypothetical protein
MKQYGIPEINFTFKYSTSFEDHFPPFIKIHEEEKG